jgi:branched-chain amino acid transport system permease protein
LVEQLLQSLISGISVGSIYAIVGLGFFVVYSTARVLNFAQGEFVMLGGMLMVTFYESGVPLLPSLLLAAAVAGLGGALMHRLLIRPAGEAPIMTLILLTVGASIVIRGVALLGWGWQVKSMPTFLGSKAFQVGPATVFGQAPWVVGAAALMVLGLFLFFDRTLLGKAMRSCAEEPLGARLQGISVKGMVLLSFVLAALLAAVAGAVMTPLTTTQYDIGIPLTLKGLLAAFAGGMDRAQGVIAGGLILGLLEALVAGLVSSGMKDAIVMTIFVGILIIRPQGLVGAPSR